MLVQDLMCAEPQCCTPETVLEQAAQLMYRYDCGALPVVVNEPYPRAIGIITDRDIVCRGVAEGKPPHITAVVDCMTRALETIRPTVPMEECCQRMEQLQLRRLLVVDDDGRLCGIISQADIARHMPSERAAKVVDLISQPRKEPVVAKT